MMKFFNWTCAYSEEYIGGSNNKNIRSIDHIVPLDNGGEHEIWNCVPMLKSYNSQKRISNMLEWYLKQPFFSIERLTKIYEWRIYAIKYYDIGVMDYSSVMYESVEEAYKEVHKLGFTERLDFLYYRHETRKFETVEIEIFKLKERE